MSKPLGLVVHFDNSRGLSQYLGWPFTSMAQIGDTYFGAGPDGLYQIGGDTDDGVDIDCRIETPTFDGGAVNQKRIRSIYLGGKFSGEMILTALDDEDNEREYAVGSPEASNQRSLKVPVGRDGKGRYWQVRLENEDGADFSVDTIDVNLLVLPMRP